MNRDIAIDLLSTCANSSLTTRELIASSGYSPNTVVRYLKEMARQGLIERAKAERFGVGQKPVISYPTPSGLELLRNGERSLFRRMLSEHEVLWGPRRTFAHWDVPFFGGADVFAKTLLRARPFELVLERGDWLYQSPVEEEEGPYPSLEPFLAWAARSANPRYLGAAGALLRRPDFDGQVLSEVGKVAECTNRLGFLATLVEAERVVEDLPRSPAQETMLDQSGPVDDATAKVARTWRVRHPVSASVVLELTQLYGGHQ